VSDTDRFALAGTVCQRMSDRRRGAAGPVPDRDAESHADPGFERTAVPRRNAQRNRALPDADGVACAERRPDWTDLRRRQPVRNRAVPDADADAEPVAQLRPDRPVMRGRGRQRRPQSMSDADAGPDAESRPERTVLRHLERDRHAGAVSARRAAQYPQALNRRARTALPGT